jgi:predicted metal-dependent hydrolase
MTSPDPDPEPLKERVRRWAVKLNVKPRVVRVQMMTRKWGSCSTAGTITLAADLNNQEIGFQNFVIAHELLHLRVPNHSRLFKALMTAYVPGWRHFDFERRKQRTPSTMRTFKRDAQSKLQRRG